MSPEPLNRKRFLSALEFPDSVAGMRQYARQLEFAQESKPAVRDSLARRYCQGWAVASEEYRRDLKKMYAALEEPAGRGGREVAEPREEKWERGAHPLTEKSRQDKGRCAARPKGREVEGAHRQGAAITLDGDKRMDRRTPSHGPPTRVCNLIRGEM